MHNLHGKTLKESATKILYDSIENYNETTITSVINDIFSDYYILEPKKTIQNNLDEVMEQIFLYYKNNSVIFNITNYDKLLVVILQEMTENILYNLSCVNEYMEKSNYIIDKHLIEEIKKEINVRKCEICCQTILEDASNLMEIDNYDRTKYCNECYYHEIIPLYKDEE